jgi:hypothetical protein
VRRSLAALVAVLAATVLAGFAPPASAAPVTYIAPVSGPVLDPFRPPTTPYGPGNRGLQYRTTPGQVVRASAPGRVAFAGQVGGARHVVIAHADGVRTSYSFLRAVNVRVGQVVQQGDPVGTTADTFHFGARVGDSYLDPAILIAGGPAQVHLIPDGEFTETGAHNDGFSLSRIVEGARAIPRNAYEWGKASSEAVRRNADDLANALDALGRHALDLARNARGKARDALQRAGHELIELAGKVRDGAFDLMQLTADAADAATRATAKQLVGFLDEIVNLGVWGEPMSALAAALADIIEAWVNPCTPEDVEPPLLPSPENRVVVFVAGLGSKSKGQHEKGNFSEELHSLGLGYWPDNTYDFSYNGGHPPKPYSARDTTRDLRDSARTLRDLLDWIAHEHPGATVDLIAHSQGGLITREALAHEYDGPGHELPEIGHVITLATPHHGADGATAAAWLRWSPEGRRIRALARHKFRGFDVTGPGVAQLSETSDFIDQLNRRPLREDIAYTSIASATDLTVPAVRTRLAGATNVIVDADPRWKLTGSHSSIKQSPFALREVQLALADAPPTCQPAWKTATRAAAGAIVAIGEDLGGGAVAAALMAA